MSLPYTAALIKIEHYCDSFNVSLGDASLAPETRVSLRERRDYWHIVGSKIRRRMDRESRRDK